MASSVQASKEKLLKMCDSHESIVREPSVFLANYFFSIRNEIDLATETLLMDPDVDGGELNQARSRMLHELQTREFVCLRNLEDVKTNPDFIDHAAKIEELKLRIDKGEFRDSLIAEFAELYEKVKKMVLRNMTIFFYQPFHGYGLLVIFEDICLTDLVVNFLK